MADEIRKKAHGTTAEHASYNGEAHQITVDTDKKTVVYQDGATNGGFPLASEALPNRTPTRDIMAGAYLIGDKYVSAQRSAYVGTGGKEFILRDSHLAWRGANAGHSSNLMSSTMLHNSSFASTGATMVAQTSGANLINKIVADEFSPLSGAAGGNRQSSGCQVFLGDGSMGGFHCRYVAAFPNANTTDSNSNFFVGVKKVSSFINSDMKSTAPDLIGIGTSSTTLLTNPRLLVITGGGGSAANNVVQDTGLNLAQNDVIEFELLSLPYEDGVLHWRVQKLNDATQTATGTITRAGTNMPASTDPLFQYVHRFHASAAGTWRLNSIWWRNFAEDCGVI